MTTRRERLEARLEKRRAWAEGRKAKSERAFQAAHDAVKDIPLGQPILVGHHSERRHRRDIDRMASNMDKGVESAEMAKHHASKASGLEHTLDTSIFSDDPDAVEALEARIAELEAQRERHRKVGAAWRKAKKPKAGDAAAWAPIQAACGLDDVQVLRYRRDCASEEGFLNRGPVPGYVLSNLGGNISRLRKRVEEVKRRQARTAFANSTPGGVLVLGTNEYSSITFAEKPPRNVLDDLRAANFYYAGGSWNGKRASIPASVLAMTNPNPE